MALCGAKNRSGEPCKKHALIGSKRCKLHGGASKGPPKGSANAIKHGFYSDALQADELELYQRAEVGSLDDEIRLAKVKLFRYVKASGSTTMSEMVDGALEVIAKQGTDMRDIPYDKRELKAEAPNYAELIIKTLDLIRKLEQARIEMELKRLTILKVELSEGAGNKPGASSDGIPAVPEYVLRPDEDVPEQPIL